MHSSRLDTMECHHLTIPAVKKGQPSFRQVIDQAQSAIHASQTGAAKVNFEIALLIRLANALFASFCLGFYAYTVDLISNG